jgi:hypothetical protein
VDLLNVDPRDARQRVNDAIDFGPRTALSGEVLPPTFPDVAGQLADGVIGIEHARVIAHFAEHVPASVPTEKALAAQQELLTAAGHTYPMRVGKFAADKLARFDQDGPEPKDEVKQRKRGFTLATSADGWSKVSGNISPLLTATFNTVFDSLAAPAPSEDGVPDDRSAAARRHDAILDCTQRVISSETLPDAGGAPATILVTITESDLRERVGCGVTGHGDLLPIADVLRLAADSEILPVVLADSGGVMSYGRARRLAPAAMRRALAARDGGCTRPGCDAPVAWCESHHVDAWEHGGETSVANFALVCRHHHRTFEREGWQIRMQHGIPYWIPPAWIDPTRTPRRNTAHGPPRRE